MTPRERAIEAIGQHETATVILEALDAAGLAIVEKPQRKGAPDAPGWWWIKFTDSSEAEVVGVSSSLGRGLVYARYPSEIEDTVGDAARWIEWSVGPPEVPTGE